VGAGQDTFAETVGPVLERLQDEGRPINVFLRDDDVDEDEETLRHLFDICLSRQVPLNAEIIPGRLTRGAVRLLKEFMKFHPDLLGLNQHGWQHQNHEANGRKCEFGGSRSFTQQLNDISQGKALLQDRFGERFYPVFTPPWNRCTADTFAVLDELGFKVLSKDSDSQPATGYRFREISITLDIFRWKGGPTLKTAATVAAELAQQLGRADPIGIMLHHKVMGEEAFAMLDQLLALLRRYPHIRFHTFQSLYEMDSLQLTTDRRVVSDQRSSVSTREVVGSRPSIS
jgi:peptidoglycan/xylan/chitin deacetylase (PgdA/CDA1 family)